MARRIIFKETDLNLGPNPPSGYKFLGFDVNVLSERTGSTVSVIGTKYTDITYSELYTKIVTQSLIPNKKYRLTDYRSVNFLNGHATADVNPATFSSTFDPRELYEGETEVLLLEAISTYELSPIAYSEKFPQDVITYQGYTNKIGVLIEEITNGSTLPNSATVSGFDLQWDAINNEVYFEMPTGYPALFGHLFYLYAEFNTGSYFQDGWFEPLKPIISECQWSYSGNYIDYPKPVSRIRVDDDGMKIVLVDLDYDDFLNYDLDTLKITHIESIGDAYGFISRRTDTISNIDVPFDFRSYTYRRYEVDLTSLNSSLGTGYYGIGDNYLGQGTTGNYIDVLSIPSGVGSDIVINGFGSIDANDYYSYGMCDNCVFLFGASNLHVNANIFYENTFYGFINNNFINGTGWFENVSKGLYFNQINRISRTLMGDNFRNNIINTATFNNNKIGNNFRHNTVGFNVDGVNFMSASFVYGDYNCNIFRRSNNTLQLSYIDGSNVVQYTAVNA